MIMETKAFSMFSSGQLITLETSERRFTFTIDKPFLPFTKSVVLLAHCDEISPEPVVVKIYDPRFLDDRISRVASQPSRPWTLAAEQAAAIARNAVSGPECFDENQLWNDEPEDDQGRAERAALWEEHFYRLSTGCFDAERSAYERLQHLHSTAIPRLLASGRVLPLNERSIHPPTLVLEHIPGLSLRDVPTELLPPELCSSLVHAVDSFAAYGVYHGDINQNNVLFTPAERPVRAVVIDFGCAGVKADDEDEESWRFNVQFAADGTRIRRILKDKGVVVPDHSSTPQTA